MSTAGVRSAESLLSRGVSIDLPRESVNESEAESKQASERTILGISAPRRGAPHRTAPSRDRDRDLARGHAACRRG